MRKPAIIFRFSGIMAGNILADALGGCISVNLPQKRIVNRDSEIFSDNESRLNLIDHVIKTRLLPIMIIFLCCVLPNFLRSIETNDPLADVFTVFFGVMALLELYLLIYCGLKLQKLRKKYKI